MRNIVLIGMSGVGKTTIGKALSMELHREFIDTDELIGAKTGLTIEEIFSLHGEDYFRKLESEIIDELYHRENLIISTGGGIVLNNINVLRLKKKGILILLESTVDNIVNNIKRSMDIRPLLNNEEDIYINVKNMYNHRKNLYLSSADFIISVNDKSLNEIVYEVLTKCVKINS